jgi:hypothetical protein
MRIGGGGGELPGRGAADAVSSVAVGTSREYCSSTAARRRQVEQQRVRSLVPPDPKFTPWLTHFGALTSDVGLADGRTEIRIANAL